MLTRIRDSGAAGSDLHRDGKLFRRDESGEGLEVVAVDRRLR